MRACSSYPGCDVCVMYPSKTFQSKRIANTNSKFCAFVCLTTDFKFVRSRNLWNLRLMLQMTVGYRRHGISTILIMFRQKYKYPKKKHLEEKCRNSMCHLGSMERTNVPFSRSSIATFNFKLRGTTSHICWASSRTVYILLYLPYAKLQPIFGAENSSINMWLFLKNQHRGNG